MYSYLKSFIFLEIKLYAYTFTRYNFNGKVNECPKGISLRNFFRNFLWGKKMTKFSYKQPYSFTV